MNKKKHTHRERERESRKNMCKNLWYKQNHWRNIELRGQGKCRLFNVTFVLCSLNRHTTSTMIKGNSKTRNNVAINVHCMKYYFRRHSWIVEWICACGTTLPQFKRLMEIQCSEPKTFQLMCNRELTYKRAKDERMQKPAHTKRHKEEKKNEATTTTTKNDLLLSWRMLMFQKVILLQALTQLNWYSYSLLRIFLFSSKRVFLFAVQCIVYSNDYWFKQ